MKILITGGPVPANLDAVKIITNKFKGGLMCRLAEELAGPAREVVYLTYKGSNLPREFCSKDYNLRVVFHSGFEDYREQVKQLAPQMDVVVLGAAVANLIPLDPWKGKFPSHDYNVGDVIPINFTIAPRIIDEVRAVATKVKLVGFKLLSGVAEEELIRAAYETMRGSHADMVIANDAQKLESPLLITKEHGVHPVERKNLADWIIQLGKDEHFTTECVEEEGPLDAEVLAMQAMLDKAHRLDIPFSAWHGMPNSFFPEIEGMRFGCVAVRSSKGFITTARGKDELAEFVRVVDVDFEARKVRVAGSRKASLNAPLLGWIFASQPDVVAILHGHVRVEGKEVQPYAPPGTVRDTERGTHWSFNVEGHGCYLLINDQGEML